MSSNRPAAPNLFEANLPFYNTYRPKFPPELLREVIGRVGVADGGRCLDLGCGPGYPAIEIAGSVAGDVVAMDPDPAMLAFAREEAGKAGVALQFVKGSSHELSPTMGVFKMVTMARSFHWMDRATTLATLDKMVQPDGAVVVLTDMTEPGPENRWHRVLKEVQDEFVGWVPSGPKHHAGVLLDSPFSRIETCGILERHHLTIDSIFGRALSSLKSSPKALGARTEAFEATLRERLIDFAPSGEFTELRRFEALIARRPA